MTRLELPDGQWIEIKDDLTVADDDFRCEKSMNGVNSDGRMGYNPVRHNAARGATRILRWSIQEDGKDVVYPSAGPSALQARFDKIRSLKKKTFEPIAKLIVQYEDAMEPPEETAEKNEREAVPETVS
jgi:hypothetical protein